MSDPEVQVAVVDARGLRCPLPVIHLARRAADEEAGTVLEVWATDPAAGSDVPAWCRMRGHEFLGAHAHEATRPGESGHTAYRLRLGGAPGTPQARAVAARP